MTQNLILQDVRAMLHHHELKGDQDPSEIISKLSEKIEEILQREGWNDCGVFVKLNSRSPKDVEIDNEYTKPLVLEEVSKELEKNGHLDNQGVLDGYMRGVYKSFRVFSGREAIHLLC